MEQLIDPGRVKQIITVVNDNTKELTQLAHNINFKMKLVKTVSNELSQAARRMK